MLKKVVSHSVNLLKGRAPLKLSTGLLAPLANGSVVLENNGNVILATACRGAEGCDKSLSVEYVEKGSCSNLSLPFLRRDRMGERSVLKSRLVDRSIRPLFPANLDAQIITNLLSTDFSADVDADIINAASASVCLSDIPNFSPIAAVTIAFEGATHIVNPTHQQMTTCSMNMLYCGNREGMVMIEMSGNEVKESVFFSACQLAHQTIQPLLEAQLELQTLCGKPKIPMQKNYDHLEGISQEILDREIGPIFSTVYSTKEERAALISQILSKFQCKFRETHPHLESVTDLELEFVVTQLLKKQYQAHVLKSHRRIDGRGLDELRPIHCDMSLYPSLHGSGLFSRGNTQSLSSLVLGDYSNTCIHPNLTLVPVEERKRFRIHYDFPPFATNEVGLLRVNRRMIGHGALAEKAIAPLIPPSFPYSITLNSDTLASDGSSSMAAVCSASLALSSAHVPVPACAGISIGLVGEADASGLGGQVTNPVLLTDILGFEDFFGGMDFKVAGTDRGMTACQVDIKVKSIKVELIEQIVEKAAVARRKILVQMRNANKFAPIQASSGETDTATATATAAKGMNHPVVETITFDGNEMTALMKKNRAALQTIQHQSGASLTCNVDENSITVFARNQRVWDIAIQEIRKYVIGSNLVENCVYEASIINIQPLVVT
eukprot:Sdes_comp19849_c0_seq1m12079